MTSDNVLPLDLTPMMAKQVIREIIAEDQSKIILTRHCMDRMAERSIDRLQIIRCLDRGLVTEGPYRDPKGNWKLNMETLSSGDPMTVVAALDRDSRGNTVIVITVF